MTRDDHPASAAARRGGGVPSFLAVTVAGAAATLVVATVSPEEPGHYPTCPFLALTGAWCPGCGSLRALHALAQGDVVTAWQRNPLAVVLLPLVALAWVAWGLRIAGRDIGHPTRIPVRWLWALVVAVLVFWAARNVPGWTWLSPA